MSKKRDETDKLIARMKRLINFTDKRIPVITKNDWYGKDVIAMHDLTVFLFEDFKKKKHITLTDAFWDRWNYSLLRTISNNKFALRPSLSNPEYKYRAVYLIDCCATALSFCAHVPDSYTAEEINKIIGHEQPWYDWFLGMEKEVHENVLILAANPHVHTNWGIFDVEPEGCFE